MSLEAGSEQLCANVHKTNVLADETCVPNTFHVVSSVDTVNTDSRKGNCLNIAFTNSKSISFGGVYYFESLNGIETNSHIIN